MIKKIRTEIIIHRSTIETNSSRNEYVMEKKTMSLYSAYVSKNKSKCSPMNSMNRSNSAYRSRKRSRRVENFDSYAIDLHYHSVPRFVENVFCHFDLSMYLTDVGLINTINETISVAVLLIVKNKKQNDRSAIDIFLYLANLNSQEYQISIDIIRNKR